MCVHTHLHACAYICVRKISRIRFAMSTARWLKNVWNIARFPSDDIETS